MADVFQYQGLADPVAPEDFALPGDLAWFVPLSVPVLPRTPVTQPDAMTAGPLDFSEFPIPGDGAWLPPVGQPLFERKIVPAAFEPQGDGWISALVSPTPDTEGLEYSLQSSRLHYDTPDVRAHYSLPSSRTHGSVSE